MDWMEEFMSTGPDGRIFRYEADGGTFHLQFSLMLRFEMLRDRQGHLPDPDLYLMVIEHCFTEYPDMRGEIGLLLGRSCRNDAQLARRLLAVFERVCASQPRAAAAAYLNLDNPLLEVDRHRTWETERDHAAIIEVLAAHPLIDPTLSQHPELQACGQVSACRQIAGAGHRPHVLTDYGLFAEQAYEERRLRDLQDLAAAHEYSSKCWWHWAGQQEEGAERVDWPSFFKNALHGLRLELSTRLRRQDFIEGLRLLLQKRPEMLALMDLRSALPEWQRYGVLSGLFDVVEGVYGHPFASYFLNRLLMREWDRFFQGCRGETDCGLLLQLLDHPSADLASLWTAYPIRSSQEALLEVRHAVSLDGAPRLSM